MSSGNQVRTRAEQLAQMGLLPNRLGGAKSAVLRGDVLVRLAMAAAAALAMWLLAVGWRPPFTYRLDRTPPRDIVANVEFSRPDPDKTEREQELAGRRVPRVYDHDPQPLIDLREGLKEKVFQILRAESWRSIDAKVWRTFLEAGPRDTPLDAAALEARAEAAFTEFHRILSDDPLRSEFSAAIDRWFAPFIQTGLLETLEHDLSEGTQDRISVRSVGPHEGLPDQTVDVREVRIAELLTQIKSKLERENSLQPLAEYLDTWLRSQWPTTLTLNRLATERVMTEAKRGVETVMTVFHPGDLLVKGGLPLTRDAIELLGSEYDARVQQLTVWQRLLVTFAHGGMYVAIFTLIGVYLVWRYPQHLQDLRQMAILLGLAVATMATGRLAAQDPWQLEVVPLTLFAITAVTAYQTELALLLSAAMSLLLVMVLGLSMPEFVILTASQATSILLLRSIRSRTKLIYAGAAAGAVAVLTTLGACTVAGWTINPSLFTIAGWYGFSALLAGVLMTGLLPFVERLLDVQTDISLLELGDAAHPLLQELVRRAPGTYNHSINVASLAEAAAEAIGCNGLLVRVGAYFHDIGKMLKPRYFVENQSGGNNRHEQLLPAMSTLIIIAHVKDGADLARQHHLPRSMVDFIMQHHGTTLVEYFYDRASRQQGQTPGAPKLDEGSYRYPGPKPQSKEAAILMLADCVEGAARSLVDPGPARIEGLVHDLAMKRLLDGQFDECGLTLEELRVIEDSLVKSLTAVYHGRVKYPSQQTA